MSKLSLIIFSCLIYSSIVSQQYPWWTQYRSNPTVLNPGFCGTKRLLDVRISYRNQWTGFEGAPKTYVLSVNSRFLKGKLGAGGFIFKDDIGPFKNFNTSLALAYHLKFTDTELSIGVQGNYLKQRFDGNAITIRNQQDKALNQFIENKAGNFDGSFGIVYYNDRFHLGLGANNIAGNSLTYYKNDTTKEAKYTNTPHFSASAGLNWADDPNYVFENSLQAMYVAGMPFSLDYTLRLNIMKQLMLGASVRFGDAVAAQLGYTFENQIQVSYSYDFVISPLRRYQAGSHEIKLVFSSNLGTDKKKRGTGKSFLKQRFQYLL